jgi:HD superfamily phosphodiesterase
LTSAWRASGLVYVALCAQCAAALRATRERAVVTDAERLDALEGKVIEIESEIAGITRQLANIGGATTPLTG